MFNKKLIKTLEKTINTLKEVINKLEDENKYLRHNEMILIEEKNKDQDKIIDLMNNIDILYNNLSVAKRKLAPRN